MARTCSSAASRRSAGHFAPLDDIPPGQRAGRVLRRADVDGRVKIKRPKASCALARVKLELDSGFVDNVGDALAAEFDYECATS